MNKKMKIGLTIVLSAIFLTIVYAVITAAMGNWFINAGFVVSVFASLFVLAVLIWIGYTIKAVWAAAIIILITASACQYAKSNQQVVVSTDCGMTWKRINAGDAIPKGGMNQCYMKVLMPNYPMQGESKFISNLKDRVRASVHIDYDYSITDPLSFIKQAKYLGKANANADDDDALKPEAFESAENTVIDKRIRDVSKGILLSEDIVELDQAEMESRLLAESNKVLEPLGVHLNFITLTFDLDEQTRQAIDISTAMKIYESKGLSDVGRSVMAARAGAPKIVIENKPEVTSKE